MYDIIVIGAGHAGIEAALASARMNNNTLLVTSHLESIAHLPCNPSIGGPAKGVVVREIDALGGQMGHTVDKTHIQIKMLNTNKGPAVQSLRAQVDKVAYPAYMKEVVLSEKNLTVLEDNVNDVLIEDSKIKGINTENNGQILSRKLIITAGTYLDSSILVGKETTKQGPDGYNSVTGFCDRLRLYGFNFKRLKTGTPARVNIETIDTTNTSLELGSEKPLFFSDMSEQYIPLEEQVPCYLTYTNLATHKIINDNLEKSSMYSGVAKGTGARYCPSIEDKIVRFSDKDRHQIFLEPESKEMNTIYVQGFSTSLPVDVQEKMIHSIVGLENAEILKFGYAIEYEAVDSTQLKLSLESMLIDGLYFAGQVNGTSGYEEAAAQGLIAGINASLSVQGKEPIVLRRDQAYIGVMIDDLVTKGTNEPYRLLTSRAEYRLLLRHDNAASRLTKIGYDAGLVTNARYKKFMEEEDAKTTLINTLKEVSFTPKHEINSVLVEKGSNSLLEGISAYDLVKRPEIKIEELKDYIDLNNYSGQVLNQVEVLIKYDGYIKKAAKQAIKAKELEDKIIPNGIDYENVPNLATEAKQKLQQIKPMSIGQATRISGINPSDIQNLLIYLKSR